MIFLIPENCFFKMQGEVALKNRLPCFNASLFSGWILALIHEISKLVPWLFLSAIY